MFLVQIILFWAAVAFYAAASVLYILSLKFGPKGSLEAKARVLALIGLLPHSAAILLRWYQTGHGPYSQLYEVAASNTWISVVLFLIIQWRYKKLELLGVFILPAAFLLLGIGVMDSKEIAVIPDTFKTYWLLIHIAFAKLTYGSCLTGTGLAVFYLLKKRKAFTWLDRLPDLSRLDELSYKFLSVGFFFNTVMIAAGSIWARSAWGSYWSWDPIETWSLIAWLVYGIYLHLRRTLGWKGSKASWMAIAAMGVMIFAIYGIAYVYPSIHEIYLKGSS